MTFGDAQRIERIMWDLRRLYPIGDLPVMLSSKYDRVEIDLTYGALSAECVKDALVSRLGEIGLLYDVWFPDGEPHQMLCVSEKGADE